MLLSVTEDRTPDSQVRSHQSSYVSDHLTNLASDPEVDDGDGDGNDTGVLANGTNSHSSSRPQTPEVEPTVAAHSPDPYEFQPSDNEMEEQRQTMQDIYGANGGELLNADLRSRNDQRYDEQINADSTQSDMSGSGAGSSDAESSPKRAAQFVRVLNSTPSKLQVARGISQELLSSAYPMPKSTLESPDSRSRVTTALTPTSSSISQWTQLHESSAAPVAPYVASRPLSPKAGLFNGSSSDYMTSNSTAGKWAQPSKPAGSSPTPTDPKLRPKPTDNPTVIDIDEDSAEPVSLSSRPSYTAIQPKPSSFSDSGASKPRQKSSTGSGKRLYKRTRRVLLID